MVRFSAIPATTAALFLGLVHAGATAAELPEQPGDKGAHHACPHHNNVDGTGRGHHGHRGHGMGQLRGQLERLDLSEQQKQEMGTLLELYRPRIQQLVERGQADRESLMAMAPDDPAYDIRVAEVSQDVSSAAAEMVVLLAELQENAYALLTPEQQATFRELQAQMQEKRSQMREKLREKMQSRGGMRGPRARR